MNTNQGTESNSNLIWDTWNLLLNTPETIRTSDTWLSSFKTVAEIKTPEQFWYIFQTLEKPDILPVGSNLVYIRDEIGPQWEDIKNRAGGKWVFTSANFKKTPDLANKLFFLLVCILSSGELKNRENYNCVFSCKRKTLRIELWTSLSNVQRVRHSGADLMEIIKNNKNYVGLSDIEIENIMMKYAIHDPAMATEEIKMNFESHTKNKLGDFRLK